MVGKAWKQEPEAAGHIILAARKQREVNTGILFFFFLFSDQDFSLWGGTAQI